MTVILPHIVYSAFTIQCWKNYLFYFSFMTTILPHIVYSAFTINVEKWFVLFFILWPTYYLTSYTMHSPFNVDKINCFIYSFMTNILPQIMYSAFAIQCWKNNIFHLLLYWVTYYLTFYTVYLPFNVEKMIFIYSSFYAQHITLPVYDIQCIRRSLLRNWFVLFIIVWPAYHLTSHTMHLPFNVDKNNNNKICFIYHCMTKILPCIIYSAFAVPRERKWIRRLKIITYWYIDHRNDTPPPAVVVDWT